MNVFIILYEWLHNKCERKFNINGTGWILLILKLNSLAVMYVYSHGLQKVS